MRRPEVCPPRKDSDSGQSTVEFAFVLPVLVMMTLVVVQIALVGSDNIQVWHAARAAAREAAVNPVVGLAQDAAIRSAPNLDATRLRVELTGGTTTGQFVTSTVTYRSPTDVPLVGFFVGEVTMSAQVTMRVE